jgi:hypothetical protein
MTDSAEMRAELRSTSRPTSLRLAGFLAIAVGALVAGVGALLPWATVGFAADVAHAADVSIRGVDVWEGVVALSAAVIAPVLLIALRASRSLFARRAMAGVIISAAAAAAIAAAVDMATARARFGGTDVRADVVRAVAERLGQPVNVVRALLERNLADGLRVDVEVGLPLSLVGGVVLIAAGVLAARWIGSQSSSVRNDPRPASSAAADAETVGIEGERF